MLTQKQKRFADEYLLDLNATQAAIRSGYSPRSAGTTGSENLANHEIRALIDAAMLERSKSTGVTAQRVLREIARIAFADSPDPPEDLSDTSASPEPLPHVNVRPGEKLKALELCGKHLGLFSDKFNMNSSIPVVITGADCIEE